MASKKTPFPLAYVAAPSVCWRLAKGVMEDLAAAGFSCHDWTAAFAEGKEAEALADPGAIALACLDAVTACDVFVVLVCPGVHSAGMWAELGAALALGKRCFVYLPPTWDEPLSRQVFLFHPSCTLLVGELNLIPLYCAQT